MAYIYKIINDINQKIYIGKTEFSIEKRWKEHCEDCYNRKYENRPLYAAMRKYGIEHFHIELVEQTDRPNEREIYWIEQYRSFKYGYNATMGGDGKKYIDYDLVILTYNQLQSIQAVAQKLNIHRDSVSNILHQNDILIKSSQEVNRLHNSKATLMFDKNNNFIQAFSSTILAAQYLIDNNLTNCKLTTIRTHISEVCRGKRKSAAGFVWKFE